MRLDKYLKVSRIIKRRTVANDLCDAGHVDVNGKTQSASYDVKENDILRLKWERRLSK
ncbi:MAG: RNA-binding S4 domain-containing protein, partial [Oscillospiraceae bacterium]|nr:RNA-binding S4 domain-containing protein [Candidatus Limimonas coprohippi]